MTRLAATLSAPGSRLAPERDPKVPYDDPSRQDHQHRPPVGYDTRAGSGALRLWPVCHCNSSLTPTHTGGRWRLRSRLLRFFQAYLHPARRQPSANRCPLILIRCPPSRYAVPSRPRRSLARRAALGWLTCPGPSLPAAALQPRLLANSATAASREPPASRRSTPVSPATATDWAATVTGSRASPNGASKCPPRPAPMIMSRSGRSY